MNLIIYTVDFSSPLSPFQFQTLLDKLPANLIQKVMKFKRWEDAHASLLGKHLLRLAMNRAGYESELDQLKYSPFQRPFFDQLPDFNLSHSGYRVACILNPYGKVGIDLEQIREISFKDFQSQFSPA